MSYDIQQRVVTVEKKAFQELKSLLVREDSLKQSFFFGKKRLINPVLVLLSILKLLWPNVHGVGST